MFFRPRYSTNPEKIKNILITKYWGMGSIILSGPALRALRKRFPKAKIIMLTFENNKEICARIKFIDEIITVDSESLLKFAKSVLKAVMSIRRKKCDVSIDMEFFAKSSALIQYLCGAKVRVGYYPVQKDFLFRAIWRGNLLTNNVYYNPHRHTSEVFLALARNIGADTDDMTPAIIDVSEKDHEKLREILLKAGIGKDDPIVTININTGQLCLERRWPIEKFAELTKKILRSDGMKIVLIGNSQDVSYVKNFLEMVGDHSNLVDLSGLLNIGMLAVLLKTSEVFITSDSGPLHIAYSVGAPTVSFFGPETPDRFGPIGLQHTVFYAGIYCSPCLNVFNQKTAPCNGMNQCMRKILVDDVYAVVKEKYLSRNKKIL
jgi:ADP-heptose:LPS heptosyltransferase